MAERRRYELRLFDRTLVDFAIADTPFGPEPLLEDYDQTADDLMPCGISMSPEGISARGIIGNTLAGRRRMAALDSFVRRQAERLPELPPVDHGELAAVLRETVPLRAARERAMHRLMPTGG